jgi:transglutaminase-like putative cysteine protease
MHPLKRRLRPIATIILVFFTWFCIEPWNFAVAQTPAKRAKAPSKEKGSSEKLEETLHKLKNLTQKLDQSLAVDQESQAELDALADEQKNLSTLDAAVQNEFAGTEAFLKGKNLPAEILDRHANAVAEYQENIQTLRKNLDETVRLHGERKQAKGRGDLKSADQKKGELKAKLRAARSHLEEKVKERPHRKLDPNNLPHRMPKVKERAPRLKKEEFAEFQYSRKWSEYQKPIQLAFNGDPSTLMLVQSTQDLPTPADLAETVEVQFTQEIQDLAAQLEHNPIKIYNWVYNNIDYVPTYGSIQGAQMCLMTKQCNDIDTASLLIALLRASGISARYVYGTIEVPIDKVMNWVGGFTDPMAALNFISSGGTPVTGATSGGKIVVARIEHVWVEAYIDYIPSRGAVHKQGDTWIPMDASFKQFTYTEGVDLKTILSFDGQTFLDQIKSTAIINETESYTTNIDTGFVQSNLRNLRDRLKNHVSQNLPNATVGDVLGTKKVLRKELRSLPGTLPFKVMIQGTVFSEISNNLRHQITFEIINNEFFGPEFSYTASLPILAGRRITLSYVPATQADQDVITSLFPSPHTDGSPILPEELPSSFPAYLINMKPELRIDGLLMATGGAVRMGNSQKFVISFFDPTGLGNDIIANNVSVGEYYAVAFDTGGIPQRRVENQSSRLEALKAKIEVSNWSGITKDDFIGDLLYGVILTYFYEVDTLDKLTAQTMGIAHMRLPSQGAFFLSMRVNYLFGVPKSVSPEGMTMDVDRIFYSAVGLNGDPSLIWKFGLASGPLSSALEHSVPEQLLSTTGSPVEAVSAVKALSIANGQGIPIYTISSANAATILPQLTIDTLSMTSIRNAINAGKIVTVSKTAINFKGKLVVGYVILDPATGTGAYMIGTHSGALAELGINLIIGLTWGLFFFAAFTTGLLGAGLFVPILLSLAGSILVASLRWAAFDDISFTSAIGTFIGLSVGYVMSQFLGTFATLAPLGLLTPISSVALPLILILGIVVITTIIFDYWFTVAFIRQTYRKRYV